MNFRTARGGLLRKRLLASTMLIAALGATAAMAANSSKTKAPRMDDPVVGKINDVEIHESDVRAVDKEMGRNLTLQDTRREEIIKLLIDTILVSSAAGKTPLDEEDIRARTTFVRNRAVMEQVIAAAGRNAVNEQAVRRAYDELVAKVAIEPEYHLYELYFPVRDANDEAARDAAEEKARIAYDRIAKGETFDAVVRDMSEAASAKNNGGNRGFVTRAMMGKEFAEVATTLEKGKTSQPIKTQAGWHLIKIEDTRLRTAPALESVREALEASIARQARLEFMDKLRSQATIRRFDNATAGAAPATSR